MPEIAYVNGAFLPLERAMVHVEDRGFQFADAVYEALRTYGGRPFAVREHLARLEHSLAAIELKHAFMPAQLETLIHEAVRRAQFPEALIYLQISRGQAKRHRGIPADYTPTLVITVRALESSAALHAHGVTVITVPDQRWARCDIKCVALLANVLAYQIAKRAGAYDAVFCDAAGTITESTAGNLFLITRGVVRTPPVGAQLLAGVTRDKILVAATAAGFPTAEVRLTRTDLLAAEEVFLTSTTTEVVPVIAVDGHPIGTGRPGPLARRIHASFTRAITTAAGLQ